MHYDPTLLSPILEILLIALTMQDGDGYPHSTIWRIMSYFCKRSLRETLTRFRSLRLSSRF